MKADVSALSSSKVAENGGSLRVITKTSGPSRAENVTMPAVEDVMSVLTGFIQVSSELVKFNLIVLFGFRILLSLSLYRIQ